MEFGIFIQGYMPGPQAHDKDAEHQALMRDAEYVVTADKNNWKYAWVTEHHALPEYSHISANEVFMAYCGAKTERIHMSSGIFNLSPRANHPVKRAEQVATLDHLLEGRFEFGTGRGAGSHEVATFNIHDPSSTKAEWDEVVWEIPRMWEQRDYTFSGDHFSLDKPHNILPKPYGEGHPGIWVACGSPPTYQKAGEHGIGALGFTFDSIYNLQPQIDAYKEGIANCKNPVGQFINDNLMMTSAVRCCEDRDRAFEQAARFGSGYLVTLVNLYHDTFPKADDAIVWPNEPFELNTEIAEQAVAAGMMLAGTPEEICEQLEPFVKAGIDQLVFGVPNDAEHEEVLEMLELFGQKVIPEFDKEKTHSTARYRKSAQPKFGPYANEPELIETIWTKNQ